MNSMRKSTFSSCSSYDSFEESGWTMYFEDFFANKDNDHQTAGSFSDVDHETSSLASDAASFMMKKPSEEDDTKSEQVGGLSIANKSYRRLSFKKRRTKGSLVDDALEDTASSPVNSPKIHDMMNQYNNRNMKQDVVKGKASGSRQEEDERRDFGIIDRESDVSELKKRGLCLVPLSMVVNYIG